MEDRQQWGTRAGFILAAIGSAVGLGNIWRFPAVAYENGGGAFFIPYLFALLTAGIPLLILEFTLGHKFRGSAPLTFARLNKKAEWIGWWQLGVSFVISTYYAVIIAWAMSYSIFAFKQSWGTDTESFLFGDYLKMSVDPGQMGSIVPNVFLPLVLVWVVVLVILVKGVKKGIEAANRIFIPLLLFLFTIIVIRAITLPGAATGLNAFFQPNWDKIMDGSVWVAAYGQIFFSLSIGFAIMITYASYLPKKGDITNNAFITGFANSSFELLAGIGVFSILGFMATQQGVGVDEVVAGGVGLAFVVFPSIINELPALNGLFGLLFFASLVLAGLTSLMSIIETYVAGIQEKFKVKRTTAVIIGGGLSAVISLLYATQGGLMFLDVVDAFINNYGVALAGLVEVVAIAWFVKNLKDLKNHANELSDIRLGSWWNICLRFVTPVVLGFMMFKSVMKDITVPYGDYPIEFLLKFGWGVAAVVIILGFVFTIKKWDVAKLEGYNKGVSK
ncbi:sodium-dependent transporter [Calidifontibacillus oryziterrae]|uniref:sodium-dependent transporter n=1 Tax=Calidifontibacillus oryziterrae TaxID=1191699 RepID=UPI0002FDFC1B|nr:sodium-dependent transporter [Calidifontibacillus oryziterrae]